MFSTTDIEYTKIKKIYFTNKYILFGERIKIQCMNSVYNAK